MDYTEYKTSIVLGLTLGLQLGAVFWAAIFGYRSGRRQSEAPPDDKDEEQKESPCCLVPLWRLGTYLWARWGE